MSGYKNEGDNFEKIFTEVVKAGKRTYYFDVKATKKNDYYLTVTERKKLWKEDGSFTVDKHKVFLYKEDFTKFAKGLQAAIDYVKEHQPEGVDAVRYNPSEEERNS